MHAFRHYRCNFLFKHNVPIPVIKQWSGHVSERMIRRYTRHRPEFHSAIVAQLLRAFHSQKEDKISLFVPKTNLTEAEESRKLEQNQGLTNLGG